METSGNPFIKTSGGISKRNVSIDILKYISIFFVIAIHFSHIPELVAFSRFAVPTFFILSGYLLHNKNDIKHYKGYKILYSLYCSFTNCSTFWFYIDKPVSRFYWYYLVFSFLFFNTLLLLFNLQL